MKNEKRTPRKLAVQIIAIILAALMVLGIAYYTIVMIVVNAREKRAEREAEAAGETAAIPSYNEDYFL